MQVIKDNLASNNFLLYQKSVLDSQQEIKIVSKNGNTLLISEEKWYNLIETFNLMNDKISLNSLLEGHYNTVNNIPQETYSISEVFDDL